MEDLSLGLISRLLVTFNCKTVAIKSCWSLFFSFFICWSLFSPLLSVTRHGDQDDLAYINSYLSTRELFPCLHSNSHLNTRGDLEVTEKVMQTRDAVEDLHNF